MKVSNIFETTRHRTYGAFGGFVWKTVLAGTTDEIGSGRTKAEAEAKALNLLQAQIQYAHKRAYFTSRSGRTTFVVYFAWGWCYDIIRDGKSRGSTLTGDTFEECCEAARNHADEYEEMD